MAKLVPLTLPLGGLNTVNPYVPYDSGYARELTNYTIFNGKLTKRPATRVLYSYYVSSPLRDPVWYDIASNRGISDNGDIFNLSTGATTGTIGAGTYYTRAVILKHLGATGIIGIGAPRLAASPFSAWTFTTLGITATDINSGCSHKGRLYVSAGGAIEYSAVGAVGGTMAGSFDVTQFMENQDVIYMASITVQPGAGAENVLFIFGESGKVLVYQGDYPASTTWNLMGNFDMPTPIGAQGFQIIDGDIFVATQKYCYWARDLFVGGAQTAYENSPSKPIENLWQSQYWGDNSLFTAPEHSHIWYDQNIDAIICGCYQNFLTDVQDYENEQIYFVYFRKYQAWALWFMSPMFAPVTQIADGSGSRRYTTIGLGYGEQIRAQWGNPLLNSEDYDVAYPAVSPTPQQNITIETSWKTPYFEAFAGKVNKVTGIRPFFEDTIAGDFSLIRCIFDYSDYNATFGFYAQSNVTAINPGNYSQITIDTQAQASNQYNKFSGLSGMGGGVSFQFTQSGTSSTGHTQSIYAATAYIEDGGIFI